MKREMFRCACCGRCLPRDPRVKNQDYCGQKKCQQARKNQWQRRKLETDPDYRAGKKESQQIWQSKNKDYWKRYRKNNLASVLRNRQLQKVRDQQRLKPDSQDKQAHTDLVKKDALIAYLNDNSILYTVHPAAVDLAKKDALMTKMNAITTR